MSAERFDCFISYSRGSSTTLAVELQAGLERFAKPWNKLRAVRVFRDDQSMAANTALWSTIEKGLRDARWLVLIATPESGSSEYVNHEVNWWLRNKGPQSLLLVRASGIIEWDRTASTFSPRSTAIPAALRFAYSEEPRWVDMTWFVESGSRGTADPRFIERVADLSAAIRGTERDALLGENVRQHRKTKRLTRAAVSALSALLVLAIVAGGVAFIQRAEAVRQRDAASAQTQRSTARQLAATAVNDADSDLQRAMLLAATAYKTLPEHQTVTALHDVLAATPQLVGFFDFGERVALADATPDGIVIAAGGESGKVYRLDRESGDRTELFTLPGEIDFVAVSDDGRTVAAAAHTRTDQGGIQARESVVWRDGDTTQLAGEQLVALSPSGRTWAAIVAEDEVFDPDVLDITVDGRTTSLTTPGPTVHWVVLPDDQTVVSMSEYGTYMRAKIDNSAMETTQTPMGTGMFGGALSPDGNRFTYTNSATDIEVWDLKGPLLPSYGDGQLVAESPSVRLSGLALNADGSKMAMAADGAIYVNNVAPRGQGRGYVELRGAGTSPDSLRFLENDVLMSSSGTAVALWDLTRTAALSAVTPAEVGKSCSACWAPAVVPSPDGTKIIVTNESGSTFVDTKTGYNPTFFSYGDDPTTDAAELLTNAAATAWLDDDRLFTYDAKGGRGGVLRGDRIDVVENSFDLPKGSVDLTNVAVQFDGRVLVQSGDVLFSVEPSDGDYAVASHKATTLTRGGAYAVDIGEPSREGTRVRVLEPDGFAVVQDITVDGSVSNFAAHKGNSLILFRNDGEPGFASATDILSLDLVDGAVKTLGTTGSPIIAANTVSSESALFTEMNGSIVMFAIDDAARLGLLPVRSAVRAWNGLGLTPDGATLIVASETASAVMQVPVSAEAWAAMACRQAGRDTSLKDLDGIVATTDNLRAGCGDDFVR